MTIKKSLYMSNLLMLIIPMILGILMVGITVFGAIKVMGEDGENQDAFFHAMDKTKKIVHKWSEDNDFEEIKIDINNFNEKYKEKNISLNIYEGKKLVYPLSYITSTPFMDTALNQEGSHVFLMDNVAIYKESLGEYNIILENTNFIYHTDNDGNRYEDIILFILGLIVILVILAIIILTNRFLTHFVFKRIILALDTLVYGVRQIRDGNLSYKIEYTEKDEFEDICSDFNEMAQRLLDSINAKQKDEANRKELIAGISHDLRTPLTSIKAYVEGLETGVASTPEIQKRYLETIKNKTSDLEHIVSQLFLFSKLDIGEFPLYLEEVDIGKELLNMMANIAEEYEKKGLTITLAKNVNDVNVNIDLVQLRNALMNVLENSVKYKNKEQGQMKVTCGTDGKYVIIKLEDNGPGVPEEAIGKLFDVFYRTDPSRSNPSKGSGLGLSITAKILEQLDGTIRAENVSEGGLAIIMMLPKYVGDRTSDNFSASNKNTGGNGIEKNSNH